MQLCNFIFIFYKQTTSGEVGLSPINASSRNHGGIWGFFFYAYWMCHRISTTTLKNATPRRVDRSDWGWVTGLVPSSAVGRAMPRIAPTAIRTPPILTSRASWLFTRASPGLIRERGNLTLWHDHSIFGLLATPTPSLLTPTQLRRPAPATSSWLGHSNAKCVYRRLHRLRRWQ